LLAFIIVASISLIGSIAVIFILKSEKSNEEKAVKIEPEELKQSDQKVEAKLKSEKPPKKKLKLPDLPVLERLVVGRAQRASQH